MIRRLAVVLALFAFAPPAFADDAKSEAKVRFDRGLRLFDQGDKAGALAELSRAYALMPNPIVLYDLALVHASMGHAVEAADALERLLAAPTGLTAQELAHAKKTLAEQSARVGEIVVTCDVEGARVELDNLEVAKIPLDKPLRVTAGTHVVGLFATGRIPSRKSVTVAGRAKEAVAFDLAPLSVAPAQLAITTSLPEVDVLANGVLLGSTPLPTTVVLSPGTYEIELRRRGYRSKKTTTVLVSGSSGSISLDLDEDPEAIASLGGRLEVAASEPGASVWIDRRARESSVALAPGMHHLRVERAGFVPLERDVLIESGTTTRVQATLEPTAETRFAWERGAKRERLVGWSLVGSGVLVGAFGGGYLVWNAGKKATANDDYERLLYESEPGAGRSCDLKAGHDCRAALDAAWNTYKNARGRDLYGFIGVGVGAAATIGGVIVLLRADDPYKYERRTTLLPSGWITAGGGGLALTGTF